MIKDRRKGERRKTFRRSEDRVRYQNILERDRKLHSLLELGQIIGLDLQLKEMLLQIAQKACEVMEAERGSLFLYDPNTDELWSTVALGMGGEVIRIPSRSGLAGACFQDGKTMNLEDVYQDPRFNKEVDAHTGYHTRSLLCMPLYTRAGSILGVIQLLNKKAGVFSEEDEAFLRIFANHVSVFIEIAQLHQARIEALEQSKKELEKLNRAKSKALDHLSHELRTPLAVIQGNIRILKRKAQSQAPPLVRGEVFDSLEKNLTRLSDIQRETDQIIHSHQELEKAPQLAEVDAPASFTPETIRLYPFTEQILENVKKQAIRREIQFHLEGDEGLNVLMDPKILEDILVGLLKNAIENTPEEGMIRVILEQKNQWIQLKVMDFGIGITKENQRRLFDGLFHTLDTELYTSKKPYDFGAGGKGLDLLRAKVYGQRFKFDISVGSQRCSRIPTDQDLCPGRISTCPHCKKPEDCLSSGGSTFCISFPTSSNIESEQFER
jgi:signal transduction histidine kinase